MSTYRKEKNLIIITLDDCNGDYTLDINSGILYGIKGNPIKVCPRKREVEDLFPCWNDRNSNLSHIIGLMLNHTAKTSEYPHWVEALTNADKIDALGIKCLCLSDCQYKYLGDNLKALTKWLATHEGERFDMYEFKKMVEFEKMVQALGSMGEEYTADMHYNLTNDGHWNYSADELKVCAYYLTRGKVWEYHNHSCHTVREYITLCRKMGKAPQKTNNFMREYVETKKDYELYKANYDIELMRKSYALHSKAWEFEYGDYKVVIPTTPKDIIDEGLNMSHCVGGYVDRVVDGRDYICFVRHKDTPDKCYITCEVHTDGEIGQYFLAHDRYISSVEDKEFYRAYADYLRKVWGK